MRVVALANLFKKQEVQMPSVHALEDNHDLYEFDSTQTHCFITEDTTAACGVSIVVTVVKAHATLHLRIGKEVMAEKLNSKDLY